MSLMTWFETLLVVATLGSGAVWLLDALFFAKRRKANGYACLRDERKSQIIAHQPVFSDKPASEPCACVFAKNAHKEITCTNHQQRYAV